MMKKLLILLLVGLNCSRKMHGKSVQCYPQETEKKQKSTDNPEKNWTPPSYQMFLEKKYSSPKKGSTFYDCTVQKPALFKAQNVFGTKQSSTKNKKLMPIHDTKGNTEYAPLPVAVTQIERWNIDTPLYESDDYTFSMGGVNKGGMRKNQKEMENVRNNGITCTTSYYYQDNQLIVLDNES